MATSWVTKAHQAAKQRAQTKGLPFNITVAELEAQYEAQNGFCYWFKIPLCSGTGISYHPASPSLDRVSSARGYTYGNVVWTCLAANLAKRDTDPDCWEEFLSLLRYSLHDSE
jgi:hypothetical protein